MAGDGGGAKIWIIDNQVGRRNITEWVKFELSLKKKDILLKQGREKQKESGKLYGENHQKQEVLSIIDKTSEEEPHNTRNIISSEIGKSTGWVGMAEVEAGEIVEAIKAETERILGQLIKDGQDAGEIAKQDTGGNVFKYATPEDIKPRTLSEIGLTAKESSTFKQIDSPDPGHHRQDAGDIVEAIKAETERQRREKQADTQRVTMKQPITQLIAPSKVRKEDNETRTKLATNFNTNRTYINEAARLKQGREKKKEEGKLYGRGNTKDEKVLSIIDRTFNEKETHNTLFISSINY